MNLEGVFIQDCKISYLDSCLQTLQRTAMIPCNYLTRLVQSRRQILERRSSVTAAAAGAGC